MAVAKSKTKKQPRHLLIDADVLLYQSSFAVEKVICFEDDLCFPVGSLEEAYANFHARIQEVCEHLKTKDYVLCFSDTHDNNFRKRILPSYKENRKGRPKPVTLSFLKAKVLREDREKTKLYPQLEGDDVLGILSTNDGYMPGAEKIIVTIDKDMKSIPCKLFNINKPLDEETGKVLVETVDTQKADFNFYKQTLTGDTTDGYKGCPGIGEVKASKLIEETLGDFAEGFFDRKAHQAVWDMICGQYEKQGLTDKDALVQARMARILRGDEYDLRTKKPKLWRI